MRIAFTIDRLIPEKGGAESYLARLGAWLVDRGHEVVVLAREARLPEGHPVRFDRVDAPRRPRARGERAFARAAADEADRIGAEAVLAVRHAESCTVYQPHGGLHADSLAAGLESRERGPARVAARLATSVSSRHRTFLDLESRLLGDSEPPRFVALSRRVERSALARYPGLAGRTNVVPNGVDLERFRPDLRAGARDAAERDLGIGDRPLLLLLAHNPRLKGIATALAALAAAGGAAGEAHLVAAGRGTEQYASVAARLGVRGRTTFLGAIDGASRWLAAADVLIHPTFHDPCSLVALEAMACGTPVITTVRNGVSELMEEDPACGVILDDPRDVDGLRAALETLADRDAAREAGGRARRIAEAHPWKRGFAAMEEILIQGSLSEPAAI